MQNVFCDWKRNANNIKGRLIMVCFRIAHLATYNRLFFFILIPYLVAHRFIFEWVLSVEIPWKTNIGKGLVIYHGMAIVINDGCTIGDNCTIRHSTTIGNKQLQGQIYSKSPIIGNNVDIGANVCIIGDIHIGNNVKIGAGSVVVKNIPSNSVVVGNPAHII
jgi:putative colanic acid biosynthesis acetyltransferase WcaB